MKVKKDILPDYDFSKGKRGKYAKQFAAGTNLIILAPDVAKIFKDAETVNEALRTLANIVLRKKKHAA